MIKYFKIYKYTNFPFFVVFYSLFLLFKEMYVTSKTRSLFLKNPVKKFDLKLILTFSQEHKTTQKIKPQSAKEV